MKRYTIVFRVSNKQLGERFFRMSMDDTDYCLIRPLGNIRNRKPFEAKGRPVDVIQKFLKERFPKKKWTEPFIVNNTKETTL